MAEQAGLNVKAIVTAVQDLATMAKILTANIVQISKDLKIPKHKGMNEINYRIHITRMPV